MRYLPLLGYVATIPAANWAITTFGLVPVGFGLLAPAGVYFAGLAFTLRDLTQETCGRAWTLGAIGAGALLSLAVSDPFVAAASATALGDGTVLARDPARLPRILRGLDRLNEQIPLMEGA